MSSIDFLIPASTQGNSNSTSSRFIQKQSWLEELEKAHKVFHNDNSVSGKNIRQSAKENISNEVVITEINETEETGVKILEMDNRVKINDINIKSPMKIFNNLIQTKSSIESICVFEGNAPGFHINNSTANTVYRSAEITMKLERMSTQFKTNYELQNINLVAGEKGIKIMLRDYRISDKDLSKIIFKIKETLTDIGIEIEKIVVNGSDFNGQDVA